MMVTGMREAEEWEVFKSIGRKVLLLELCDGLYMRRVMNGYE